MYEFRDWKYRVDPVLAKSLLILQGYGEESENHEQSEKETSDIEIEIEDATLPEDNFHNLAKYKHDKGNRCTIRGCITKITGPLKSGNHNVRYHYYVRDKLSTDLKLTAFNDDTKRFKTLKENKRYIISNLRIKEMSFKGFRDQNTPLGFEGILDKNSTTVPEKNLSEDVYMYNPNYLSLKEVLETKSAGDLVDLQILCFSSDSFDKLLVTDTKGSFCFAKLSGKWKPKKKKFEGMFLHIHHGRIVKHTQYMTILCSNDTDVRIEKKSIEAKASVRWFRRQSVPSLTKKLHKCVTGNVMTLKKFCKQFEDAGQTFPIFGDIRAVITQVKMTEVTVLGCSEDDCNGTLDQDGQKMYKCRSRSQVIKESKRKLKYKLRVEIKDKKSRNELAHREWTSMTDCLAEYLLDMSAVQFQELLDDDKKKMLKRLVNQNFLFTVRMGKFKSSGEMFLQAEEAIEIESAARKSDTSGSTASSTKTSVNNQGDICQSNGILKMDGQQGKKRKSFGKDSSRKVKKVVPTVGEQIDGDEVIDGGMDKRKAQDNSAAYAALKPLFAVEEGVGLLHCSGNGQISTGTAFRVGAKYVMTAYHNFSCVLESLWHLIFEHLEHDSSNVPDRYADYWSMIAKTLNVDLDTCKNIPKMILETILSDGLWYDGYRNVKEVLKVIAPDNAGTLQKEIEGMFQERCSVKFGFTEVRNLSRVEGNTEKHFIFSYNIPFGSKKLDVLILELMDIDREQSPSIPCRFKLNFSNITRNTERLNVLGHPGGRELQTDLHCQLITKEDENYIEKNKIKWREITTRLSMKTIEKGYANCRSNKERILFNVSKSTTNGASGAPCIIVRDKVPVVFAMLIKGYPDFFFNSLNPREQGSDKLDPRLLVEAGVPMSFVSKVLKEKGLLKLNKDIFRPNVDEDTFGFRK